MWKNVVDPERPHTTIWLMRLACWIPEATHTNTHTHTHTPSEYVIHVLLLFHGSIGYATGSRCYVTRALPVLFLT